MDIIQCRRTSAAGQPIS